MDWDDFNNLPWGRIILHSFLFLLFTYILHEILETIVYGSVAYIIYQLAPDNVKPENYMKSLQGYLGGLKTK